MSDGQELVAVMLPRHMVAAVVNGPKMPRPRDQFMDAFEKAGKQALANPSVTVEGFVSYDKSYGRVTLVSDGNPDLTGWIELATVGKFTKAGITITPKGGQSGE